MKSSLRHVIKTSLVLLGVVFGFFGAEGTSAVTDFEGYDSHGSDAKCSTFIHGFIHTCGDPLGSEGGGASWHVYKINGGDYPQYTDSILGGTGTTIDDIIRTCERKNQDYFVAYGWDGRNNSVVWGPAAWGTGAIRNAEYNNYHATSLSGKSAAEIKQMFKSGEIPHGQRLRNGSAEILRKAQEDASHETIDMSVGAFCFDPEKFDPALSAKSNVGASSEKNSDYRTTDIVSDFTSVTTNTINVDKDHAVEIRFSHNIYADSNMGEIDWSIAREGMSNSGFTIVGAPSGSNANGTGNNTGIRRASFSDSDKSGAYFIAAPRPYSDGATQFIWRDVYNITFTEKGTYTFCETLSAAEKNKSQKQITKVCVVVQVGEGTGSQPVSGACGEIASLSTGQTEVVTRIKNLGNSERTMSRTYSGWQTQTYAMPTDQLSWLDCYLPGAQVYANYTVSHFNDTWDGDGGEGGCRNTTNATLSMTSAYANHFGHEWTNQFKVATTSPFGFNDSSLRKVAKFYWPNPNNSNEWQTYSNGDYTVRQVDHNMLVNGKEDVNRTYKDTINTPGTPIWSYWANDGRGYHPWTCTSCNYCGCCCCGGKYCYCCGCCSCTYQHTNLYNEGWARDGAASDYSQVTIPYNFRNTTEHSVSSPNGGVVYAGETINVSGVKVQVNERQNNVVEASYTTVVDDASVLLIAYVTTAGERYNYTEHAVGTNSDNLCNRAWIPEKQCQIVQQVRGVRLNDDANLHGKTEYYEGWNGSYNVFDASAGDYMCFTMAVYPYLSGALGDTSENGDKNTRSNGNREWKLEQPHCILIAKKPSVQILGGDLFTGGSISTNVSEKNHLLNINSYQGRGRSFELVTGSWVEEGIVALGKVTEMSSGASLGKSSNAWSIGGANATHFCNDRTPLSFANFTSSMYVFRDGICSSSGAGGSEAIGMLGITPSTTNRKALADYWGDGNMNGYDGNLAGSGGKEVPSATGKDIKVIENNGNISVGGGYIGTNLVRVVKAVGGTVTISGNIEYTSNSVSSAGVLPKVIIYGQNINIECRVTRVDAILIAEGTINSCSTPNGSPSGSSIASNGSGVNNRGYSVQLVVNGAVIANKVNLPRTYGNSVGNRSGEAAEVFNYDTSMMIWGRYMAGASESDTMTVTYMRELAPRY